MKALYLKTGCPWKAKYAFKLAMLATTSFFIICIIVIRTLSLY